jgi:hypothetical protein
MSLLALVSSQRLTVSQTGFINIITASTLNVSSIGGGNLITQNTITSTIEGLGSLSYVSSASLFSTVAGLGSASYVSSPSLLSTTADLQRQFQTSGFLSSPNLLSTVEGLGSATYISSPQLLSTSAGIASLLGTALVTSNLTSTVGGIATSFSISSLTTSTMNKLTVFEGNPQIMLSGTSSGFSPAGTLIRISRNSGNSWGNISSGDFTSAAVGFGYNGRMWVAVGAGGASIKYSFDALNWSNAVGGFESQGQAVAWNGRMWVAVGYGSSSASTIRYSYDGINWQGGTNGFPATGYSVAWGGDMWMAVGAESTVNNRIKYSFNGINWSNRNSGPTISFNTAYQNSQIVFGKNLWVAVGAANTASECIQVSSDGSNWTGIQSGGFAQCNAQAIAYNGTVFTAAGADTIQTRWSYNGLNWSNGTGANYYTWYSVLYTGSIFYAVAQVSFEQTLKSSDGIFWDFATSPGNSLGFGLGFSSNSVLTYDQSNLQITGNNQYNVIGSWTSTSMIVPQYGNLNINDALFINRPLTRVGVNCNIPRYTLDLQGSLNTTTLLINTTNFTTILTSTVAGIGNSLGPSLPSSVSTSYGQTFRTSNLIPSSISFVNIPPPSSNLWIAVGQDSTQNNTIKYSGDGSNWSNSSGTGFTTMGYAVAFGSNMWVAVGFDSTANNTIKFSGNGINWSNAFSGGFTAGSNGYGVAWNGRLWVAVGSDLTANNRIKYSLDGMSWLNSTGASFSTWGRSVAWNGRLWVAVGADSTANNTIKYSANGINWSNSSSGGFSTQGWGIAWNGRMWVAVGQDTTQANTIKYSYDGSNWFNSMGYGFTDYGSAVAWNGRMWVAVGYDTAILNSIRYSFDGINWSNSLTGGFTSIATGVAWNGSLWVAVGQDTTQANRIKYSGDGINWSNSSSGSFSSAGGGIAFLSNVNPSYTQSNFNILPQNIPVFLTSTNSIFIQPSSMILNDTLTIDTQWDRVGINCNVPQNTLDVAGIASLSTINFVNIQPSTSNMWVAIGIDSVPADRKSKFSYDGINWCNAPSTIFNDTGYGVAYNGRLWVAVGCNTGVTQGTIKYSFDGLSWTNCLGSAFSGSGYGVAWNGRMWVAVGADTTANNTIKYSMDGITWSNSLGTGFPSGSFQSGWKVAWNGQMWVTVGIDYTSANHSIKYSYNGLNWSPVVSGGFVNSSGRGIAWNGRMWVATGQNSASNDSIKYSYDGLNWSNSPGSLFNQSGYGVAWNGYYWVAVGQDTTSNNRMKYSFDGINWSNSVSGAPDVYALDVAWNGSLWVAACYATGSNNHLKYSRDGSNWSNSTGSGFTIQAYGVGFSSNTTPSFNQNTLSILPQNIPLFYTSTNTITPLQSSIIINDSLIVDKQWDRVGINCNVPQNTLDVAGQTFTSSLQTNIVSTVRVQASTIAVLNVPTLLLWADATKAIANGSTSVVSSMSNIFVGSNYLLSNGSSNASMILPYNGSYMFEIGGWVCGSGNMTAGMIGYRGTSTIYQRIRAVPNPGCGISIVPFFWNLFNAGDRVQFYKNENNGSFLPLGLSPTMQVGAWTTNPGDDQQGPIKVWYYGGSGNI